MKLLFIFILLLFKSSFVNAELINNLNYSYYNVTIKQNESLSYAITRVSPIKENHQTFHGNTKYYIKWHFLFNKYNTSCEIKNSITSIDTNITLPHLLNGNREQLKQFNYYLHNLMTHENGHYQIGLKKAQEIDKFISMSPVMSNCTLLENYINNNSFLILEKNDDYLYDQKTQHGKTQGAFIN